jgi:glutamyl-Q tRNA(Asp) synthetase
MGLVYPAFMGRSEVRAATPSRASRRDPDGTPLYPGTDRDLDPDEARALVQSGKPYALRLRMDRARALAGPLGWTEEGSGPSGERGALAAVPEAWGDVVVARRETPTSYHLSVVIDDALQGVTTVVRGQDLFHATSVHVLLQRLLGLPTPKYHHHRLILGPDGRKLSKAERSASLAALRASGVTSAEVRRMVEL